MKREAEKTIKARVLVVDDDRLILRMLQTFLDQKGFESVLAADGEEAERFFAAEEFDVVLADVLMPKMDGIQLLERIHEKDPEIPVIMITASGQINTAYEAMKKGAYDYIPKPFNNEDLYQRLLRAIEKFALVKRNRQLSEAVEKKFHFDNIIGVSGQMEEVFRLIRNVAVSNASILIQGESGTGKELVAGAIHNHSRRKEHPFIAVNCAAIPKELMESELFGHVKGSFTGAITDKKGRFELADGGTIFLDEIGDLDISLQAKILRALQEREFERVGGTQPIKVDIRLIAATNKDLSKAMKEGAFREDLFYRLSAILIPLPPLREREQDIPYLAEHFLTQYSHENQKEITGIDPIAMKALKEYEWPGNVRELENSMERAVVMAAGDWIRLSDLPLALQSGKLDQEMPADGESRRGIFLKLGQPMREVEREYILRTLREVGGVKKRAAEVLGISIRGLRDKLKEYGYRSTQE